MTETQIDLVPIDGFAMPVLVSPGHEQRGRSIAALADRAYTWLAAATDRRPPFTLYVVDRDDWDSVAEIPLYGMPQTFPGKVITSPEPADWWVEYVRELHPHLPPTTRTQITKAFGDPPDFTTLADLVVTHEVTHLFHEIDPITWASEFPADWVMELFANVGMWGFLAEHDPHQLELLSAMTAAARAVDPEIWAMQDLASMGQSMENGVSNYLWYEFRLIGLAESIWSAGGTQAMLTFQRTLGDPMLDSEAVAERLGLIDPDSAHAIRQWPSVR